MKVKGLSTKLLQKILHWDNYRIFTHRCILCSGNALRQSLCKNCMADMPFLVEQHLPMTNTDTIINHTTLAACQYSYPVNKIITRYKHHHDMQMLDALVQLLMVLPKPSSNTLIVPMPSSKQTLRERGFDHMYLLCTKLAAYWNIPLWDGLCRIDSDYKQQSLDRIQRLSNMENKFYLHSYPSAGKQLLLIDDVCTTGSTLKNACECLQQTGLHIQCYVIAKQT